MRFTPLYVIFLLLAAWLTACASATNPNGLSPSTTHPPSPPPTSAPFSEPSPTPACPVTEPKWLKPPEDSAVSGSPDYGYYFVNQDRSILASAWWWDESKEHHLRSNEGGNKIGWFRPTGAALEITGERIDAQAAPLEAHVPCCYLTRFQASGLLFPTDGCWKVAARVAESELTFVVWVEQ